MRKLGIAALGMFAREKLSLEVRELEHDLEYMQANLPDYEDKNRKMLKGAELFLGSFFFIHDSRNKNDPDEKEAAFVFLHKTFYEFLVADLVLRDLFIAVDWVNERKSSKKNGSQYYWEALNHPDSFSETFYAVLSGGCLCMEPGIIQMIAEWQERKLYDYFGGEQSPFNSIVGQVMEDIFHSHMAMIRNGTFQSNARFKGGLSSDKSYPQACAIYLLNLLILRVLIQGECRIKIEDWRFVSQFIRLNVPSPRKNDIARPDDVPIFQKYILPSDEIILKFMAQFQLQQEDDTVLIKKRVQVRKFEKENLLEARINIFDFAQDTAASAIFRLHDVSASIKEKRVCQEKIYNQRFFNFEFEQRIVQLKEILLTPNLLYSGSQIIENGNACLSLWEIDPSLALEWLLCVQQYIRYVGSSLPLHQKEYHRYIASGSLYERYSTGNVDSWEQLRDVVFTRYIDCTVIV